MTIVYIITVFVVAYLIGSVPTAVWYGKKYHQTDVREHGSGNAGATNTFRVLGKKAGSIVMAIDVFKGFLATMLPVIALNLDWFVAFSEPQFVHIKLFCGIGAVIGHIFPLYASFKGGKGVATLLGMVIGINPIAALGCVAVFLTVFLTSKYVSLSSMVSGLAFPLLLLIQWVFEFSPSSFLRIFGFVIFGLLVFTHRKNIKRLMNGEENRANFSLGNNR